MDGDGGFERWGGDVDFNELAPGADLGTESPRWEPTPPSRWGGKRIALVVGGALLATLVGVGGVLGVMSLAGSDEPGTLTDDPTATPDGSRDVVAPPVIAPPAELEWYAVDGTLGFARRVAAAADGTFYALSTAPGPMISWPAPQAIYSSSDGEAWDFAVLADDIGGSDMAVRNDTIYLIGTAPGLADFGEAPVVVINSSEDGGLSWDQVPLPTVAIPPRGAGDVGWTETSMHVASSAAGLVAVVQTNFWLDFWQLVPQEVLVGEVDVRPGEDGVEVIDYSIWSQLEQECEAAGGFPGGDADPEDAPEPCRQLMTGEVEEAVVATFTWDELGLEGGQPVFSEVFISPDGSEWEAVDSPFAAGRTLAALFATANGFIASQWADLGGNTIWYSPDGRTWDETSLAGFEWIVSAGSVGGRDVILGNTRAGAAVAWGDGSGGWTEIDLSGQVAEAGLGTTWLAAGGVGPLGVVALINSEGGGVEPPSPVLVRGTAPDDWVAVPLDALTGGGWGYSDWVAVGSEQVLLRYVESGGAREVNLQLVGLPGDAAG